MLALKGIITIHARELLDPPFTLDKSSFIDTAFMGSLLTPKPKPGSPDKPWTLAASALYALEYNSKTELVEFAREWNEDEWSLVMELLFVAKEQKSKQTMSQILKNHGTKRGRGRPKNVNKPLTMKGSFARGMYIDQLISAGMTQAKARQAGAERFCVSPRTADDYHLEFQKTQSKETTDLSLLRSLERFRKQYLMNHWQNRSRYRDQGCTLKEAATTMLSTGSSLHIHLELFNSSNISLSLPPKSMKNRQQLLSTTPRIHDALLLCVDPVCLENVTRRDIIVRWPEDVVIDRILEEARKLADASISYEGISAN